MGKERKLTKSGFEDIYPETVEKILTNDSPENIALDAGLSKRQWDSISHYLDDPNFYQIAKELNVGRANIYTYLSHGFAKLERWRRGKNNE